MIGAAITAAAGLAWGAQPAAKPDVAKPAKSPVAFPHPLITEVLYDVPKGKEGDADGDGTRSATGDEFIELINPHDRPINLKGYTLTDGKPGKGPETEKAKDAKKPDRAPGKKGEAPKAEPPRPEGKSTEKPPDKPEHDSRVRFTFPDLTLQPGQIVVVFNGYNSAPPGPVGDSEHAPSGPNDHFHNAYVFSMKVTSQYVALANAGDCVLLSDPAGKPVECVRWGTSDKTPDAPAPLTETAPESKGSVQRDSLSGPFVQHKDLKGEYAGKLFSPGRFGEEKK